jgi:DNA polymerase I-like protein with 3'-5' exonuclease and polymerase domains
MKQKLRSMIVAPKGKLLVACDLSQAETWVVMWLANEPNGKNFLLNSDIHTETACSLFDKPFAEIIVEERYIGKQNNHANSYGMGPERQAQVINKRSDQPPYVTVTIAQCRVYQKGWHSLYPNVHNTYHAEVQQQLSKNMTLVTPYGRRRVFFQAWGKELFKAAYAHIPQSTVSDHFHGLVQPELGIEGGLLKVYKDICTPEIRLVNDSHDSCMLEVPKDSALEIGERVRNALRRPVVISGEEVTIPVDLEIGTRWGELEKIKEKAA